jgi:hypothetical protein
MNPKQLNALYQDDARSANVGLGRFDGLETRKDQENQYAIRKEKRTQLTLPGYIDYSLSSEWELSYSYEKKNHEFMPYLDYPRDSDEVPFSLRDTNGNLVEEVAEGHIAIRVEDIGAQSIDHTITNVLVQRLGTEKEYKDKIRTTPGYTRYLGGNNPTSFEPHYDSREFWEQFHDELHRQFRDDGPYAVITADVQGHQRHTYLEKGKVYFIQGRKYTMKKK